MLLETSGPTRLAHLSMHPIGLAQVLHANFIVFSLHSGLARLSIEKNVADCVYRHLIPKMPFLWVSPLTHSAIHLAASVDLKRRRLPGETDCPLSTRYCGARLVWIWCISKQSLYLILLATANQWSCFRAGVTWSRRRRSSTRRAEFVVAVRLL